MKTVEQCRQRTSTDAVSTRARMHVSARACMLQASHSFLRADVRSESEALRRWITGVHIHAQGMRIAGLPSLLRGRERPRRLRRRAFERVLLVTFCFHEIAGGLWREYW